MRSHRAHECCACHRRLERVPSPAGTPLGVQDAAPVVTNAAVDPVALLQGVIIGVSAGGVLSSVQYVVLRCQRRDQIHYICSLVEEHRATLLAESVPDVRVEEGKILLRTGEDWRHGLFVLTKRYVEQALDYRSNAMTGPQILGLRRAFGMYDDLQVSGQAPKFGLPISRSIFKALDALRFLESPRRRLLRRQRRKAKPR